jgi:hypothetical protein
MVRIPRKQHVQRSRKKRSSLTEGVCGGEWQNALVWLALSFIGGDKKKEQLFGFFVKNH